jgi:4,5-dihydroxyphthalate decarboxylase
MGEDFWSYGVEPNRRELTAVSRYAHEQGINQREVAPEELFAASTLSLAKNLSRGAEARLRHEKQ